MRTSIFLHAPAVIQPGAAISVDQEKAGYVTQTWFDPIPYLGARGYKYYSDAGRLVLSGMAKMLQNASCTQVVNAAPKRGAIVGTNFGNFDVLSKFGEVIRSEGAEHLQPMEAPNFSINVPASLLSIKHELRAFNITLTHDLRAGIDAVIESYRALSSGRADAVIAGAVEPTLPMPVARRTQAISNHVGVALYALSKESVDTQSHVIEAVVRGRLCTQEPDEWDRLLHELNGNDGRSPAAVVLCSDPEKIKDRASFEQALNQREWSGLLQCRDAFSTLSALIELQALMNITGRKMIFCLDSYGGVTGMTISTLA